MRARWLALLASALLAACSLGPATKTAPATYDFGAQRNPPAEPKIRASVLVQGVAPAAWLDTPAVVYRLDYQDGARQEAYALTRWAAPPASLLAQRLRARLAAASEGGVVSLADNARADYALRVDLDDFSQVFDSLDASRAVVVAQASLIDTSRRTLVAQKSFRIERAAPPAKAQGAVRALATAGDELVEAIAEWTAASLAREKK